MKYNEIAEELCIDVDELEVLVIDVVKTGIVEAKMNQLYSTVTVIRSTNIEFKPQDWNIINATLEKWENSLNSVLENFDLVTTIKSPLTIQ